jgi:hypothetical protein
MLAMKHILIRAVLSCSTVQAMAIHKSAFRVARHAWIHMESARATRTRLAPLAMRHDGISTVMARRAKFALHVQRGEIM